MRNLHWPALLAAVAQVVSACGTGAGADAASRESSVADTQTVDAVVDSVAPDGALADAVQALDSNAADGPGSSADVPTLPDTANIEASVGPYPAGPYGNTPGAVLANLSWEGCVNPLGHVASTTLPYGPTSMQAQRALGRYALVHVSDVV